MYTVITDEEQKKMPEALMGTGHVPRNSAEERRLEERPEGRWLEERRNPSGPVFTYNGCAFIHRHRHR